MLIVAMPKSASTSLTATLRRLHGLGGGQRYFPDRPAPDGWEQLGRLHSDVCTWTADDALRFRDSGAVWKQHLVPTREHRRLVRSIKKVLLLRNPIGVPPAYQRAMRAGLMDYPDAWEPLPLINELARFRNGWEVERRAHPEMCCTIRYESLIHHPQSNINVIEHFFGLPESEDVTLARERYTREVLA